MEIERKTEIEREIKKKKRVWVRRVRDQKKCRKC